ncbi:OmpH family outer membrane protein [Ichthyobacterium seriolicida]|uniref:Outer membrane protein H n=1 Tax=Ichthyobacterium seriolicida TaxID=242600 RepID=A0A1J1DYA8_9FLAO|nr:OmpH family outer membrane protein [Ichthyobacterium seriolicida]BAV94841.1 outer membrane protein H precursor [Ichthyobacterium seriolicida]
MSVKSTIFLTVFSFSSLFSAAQRIGYVDVKYILENFPSYKEAQGQIDQLSKEWQSEIDLKNKEIKKVQNEFLANKALFTEDMIREKESEIGLLEKDLEGLRYKRFGPDGDLIIKRQLFVRPIQDEVWNAVQEIAKKRRLDFVLDISSSGLSVLYANKKLDYSEDVLKIINK